MPIHTIFLFASCRVGRSHLFPTFIMAAYPLHTSLKKVDFSISLNPAMTLWLIEGLISYNLLPKGASLNIPAFSYGETLSSKAVKRSRKITSVRIHVERAIGRMKTFRILGGTIPMQTMFLLNQLVTIVAALSNLHCRFA